MMISLSMPVYTALFASLLIVLHIVLMGRVIQQRGAREVLIGDGSVSEMEQAIRVHGNLIENAPVFLIGLMLCELMAGSTLTVLIIGGLFVISRIAHAVGFSMTPGVSKGRLFGTLGTMLTMLAVAGYAGYLAVTKL